MRRAGFDLASASTARRDPREIAAYVELHIEQGPWLEIEDVPIGVVERIVGIRRFRLTFVGQPDHAGTTPMDRRKDAFFTAAEYATKSRELVVRSGEGRAVTTIGVVEVRPGVPNIVPERAMLLQELRDADPAFSSGSRAAPSRPRGESPASGAWSSKWSTSCGPIPSECRRASRRRSRRRPRSSGFATRRMPSGAGHDAQVLAAVTDAGMIFVPSQGGRSHRPDEWTDWPALERGANMLLGTLLHLGS